MKIKDLPQFPDFTEISLEHKGIITEYLKKSQPQISEMNFTEMFIWRNKNGSFVCRLRDNVCLLEEKEKFFYPPIGIDHPSETMREMLEWQEKTQRTPRIFGLTDRDTGLSSWLASKYAIEENRDCADYVYLTRDLIELKGHRYDGKRNLIKQFGKNYRFEYFDMTRELIPECLAFQKKWCEAHGCIQNHPLRRENIAAQELLNNFELLDVFGGVIKIDGEVQAFTAGSELNPETAVIHLEKGNPNIKGIYQTINRMFCENRLAGYTYVNREQDMGVEGLRKAKMSYHPHHLVNKKMLMLKKQY